MVAVSGCESTAATTTVAVRALPTATVSGTATICQGSSTDHLGDFDGLGPWTVDLVGRPRPEHRRLAGHAQRAAFVHHDVHGDERVRRALHRHWQRRRGRHGRPARRCAGRDRAAVRGRGRHGPCGQRRRSRGLDLRVDADGRDDRLGPGHGRDHVQLRHARGDDAALGRRDRRRLLLAGGDREGAGRLPRRCRRSIRSTTSSTPSRATASPSGCGDGTTYCPDAPNTRAQMAVFLLKVEVRLRPRSAPGLRARLPGRPGRGPVRALDRGALQPRHLQRLRRRQLLPARLPSPARRWPSSF